MLEFFVVDAFADAPYNGNPAAVCVLDEYPSDQWMQSLASEINLAETAFIVPDDPGYRLRWFTPGVEVDLCGHATLAAAHVLWNEGYTREPALSFETRSGILAATRDGSFITLDFPAERPSTIRDSYDLTKALGARPVEILANRMDLMAIFDSEDDVRSVTPDMSAISDIPVRGVIVTAPAVGKDYDFVSRFFAPRVGVPEDPVTGSAHCALAPIWSARLQRDELVGYQASRRGGVVRTTVRGDRVWLSGQAVSVYSAKLGPAAAP